MSPAAMDFGCLPRKPKAVSVRFLPGDKVRIGDIRGHVSCVSVYWQTRVRYEVTYWREGSKCEVWCDEFEVEAA